MPLLGGRRWRRIRAAQLAAQPACELCAAAGILSAAAEVDHIVRRADGGSDRADNLRSLCRRCHRAVTTVQNREQRGRRCRRRGSIVSADGSPRA